MTMRKQFLALAALLALAIVAACGGSGTETASPRASPSASASAALSPVFSCKQPPAATTPQTSGFPVTVDTDTGPRLSLKSPPRSIVSLSAGHTEVLFAVGAGKQVAAVDKTSDCPDSVSALPKVDAFSPSVEAIAAQKPDLVVLFFDPGGLVDALTKQGIPTLLLKSPGSINGVYDQTLLLGKITGHGNEAARLVQRMSDVVAAAASRVNVAAGPRVFHEVDNTYYTVGPGSFIDALYGILKAQNIAKSTGQPYPQMSAESIVAADPQAIILADEQAGENAQTVAARPGWSAISAVKSGRIYSIDPNIASRPGPRVIDALLALGHDLYPDRFP